MGGRRRRGLADLIGEVGAAPQEHEDEGRGRESAATDRSVGRRARAGRGAGERPPRGSRAAMRPRRQGCHLGSRSTSRSSARRRA